MRRYIDEYFVLPGKETLNYTFEDIKKIILENHQHGMPLMHIVEYLQEKLYVFEDQEETNYLKDIIQKIINGEPVQNRWTKVKFQ